MPKHLSHAVWHADEWLEAIVSLSVLYLSTLLYFARLQLAQIFALVLLAVLGILLAVRGWFGPSPLSRARLGLHSHRGARDVLGGLLLAFLGWRSFSEYVNLTRGYRLAIDLSPSLALLATVVSVALAEEMFFRGYIHARLSKVFCPLGRAVVVSFALAAYKNLVHLWEGHDVPYHIELFVVTFLFSFPLSLWREMTSSVVGPVVTHVLWDLLVYGVLDTIPNWVF